MITRYQLNRIKKMNLNQMEAFLANLYKAGFIDGLRECESEFDDALIMELEEAAEYFTQEAINRAINEKG